MTANLIDDLDKILFRRLSKVWKLQQLERLQFLIYKSDLFKTVCE